MHMHMRVLHTAALSPSSPPVTSLLHSSAAGPKAVAKKAISPPICLSLLPHTPGCGQARGGERRPCSTGAKPPPSPHLRSPGWAGVGGWLLPRSQLLAPSERLMEKGPVAMKKIFRQSIPTPHKKNLPHIRHIFQCNYPQPTHTAWRIKT